MAYDTAQPPAMISQRVGSNGGALWFYNSADAATAVRVDGYITNAEDLGMVEGDIVLQSDLTGQTVAHQYVVMTVNANGSADLSDGSAISIVNTD